MNKTEQRAIRKGKKSIRRGRPVPSPFPVPRGAAAAATKSLGLLGPFRAAPLVDAAAAGGGGGTEPGSLRKRAAEGSSGSRGDTEQEEARTRLSMPSGRAALREALRSLSPYRLLARARVFARVAPWRRGFVLLARWDIDSGKEEGTRAEECCGMG